MFNLGPGELIVILVLALIIFGPGRLPEVGRAVGKTINEFKRAMSEPEREIPRQTSTPAPEPSPARLAQNSTTDNEGNKG